MILKLLESPRIYSLWQAPFVSQKLVPFFKRRPTGFAQHETVVELGCGPGTNASALGTHSYEGWDLSPAYILAAQVRHPHLKFGVADVTTDAWVVGDGPRSAVFMNSLLHHLDDSQVDQVMDRAERVLISGGEIHVMDLVLPESAGLSRLLALSDRGQYPRSLSHWSRLLSRRFETLDFEPYFLGGFGLRLWSMVYWRGVKRG